MPLDISGDYAIWDGSETVTHTSKPATGNVTDSVAKALRRAVTIREVTASGGYYTMQDTIWHLALDEMAYTPKEGDTTTDASSVVWTIIEVAKQTLSSRWRCVCRRER